MAQEKFERFGNYILLEKLASGGMAEIYLAKKLAVEGVQKFVAVKRILSQHSASEDFIRMFKDEARIAVNLSHSNVVSIYDFGVQELQLYLVMDYVEGKNLRQILNRLKQNNKRFSISHIAFISKLIAAGLDHAHRLIEASTGQPLHIIHRDMSPQNVMVSYEGEVKIIDFGIAKSETQEENTRVGTLKGKFGYMSPEQVDGMEVDARTDIFALGIMIWEMLSEQRLFLTNNEMTTLRRIRDCKIPSLREIDPNIPIELEKIVNKGLARNKTQRYQTAAELQKDLQSFLNRYNPDFSSQDFAEFVKEIYAEEIVEARKRQVAYSKIDILHVADPTNKAKMDAFTQSMSITYSKNDAEQVSFNDLELKKSPHEALQLGEISSSNLAIAQPARGGAPRIQTPLQADHFSKSSYSNSAIRVSPPPASNSASSSIIGVVIVLFAGLIGVFALLNETQPQTVASQCNMLKDVGLPLNCYNTPSVQVKAMASKSNTMKVTSDPKGAYIYVNGQSANAVTPADIEVDPSKPFTIAVAMTGYKSETTRYNTIPTNGTAYFRLASMPTGFIVVRIVGGEGYLGAQKLQNGQRLAVEAQKVITLKFVNPMNGQQKDMQVSVEANQTREIILSPR